MNKFLQIIFSVVVVLLVVCTITSCNKPKKDLNESAKELSQNSKSLNIQDTVSDQELNAEVAEEANAKIQALAILDSLDNEIPTKEISLELDTIIEIDNEYKKKIIHYAKYIQGWSHNGKYYGFGKTYDSRFNAISKNTCDLRVKDCGLEMGPIYQLLENGNGFAVVCSGSFIRVDTITADSFVYDRKNYWEIKEERDYFSVGKTTIGLTHDGNFLYKVNIIKKKEREYFVEISQFDLVNKTLVWKKIVPTEKLSSILCFSSKGDKILTSDFMIYDNDFNLLIDLGESSKVDNSLRPKFIQYSDKEFLVIPTKNKLFLYDFEKEAYIYDDIYLDYSDKIMAFCTDNEKLVFNTFDFEKKVKKFYAIDLNEKDKLYEISNMDHDMGIMNNQLFKKEKNEIHFFNIKNL